MPDLQSEIVRLNLPHSKLLKLIWEYVKENPGMTNKRLLAHFSKVSKPMAISRNTYDLVSRGMLLLEKRKVAGSTRLVNFFTVNPRMQGVYEEWPAPPKAKKEKATKPTKVLQALAETAPKAPRPMPKEEEPYMIADRAVYLMQQLEGLQLLVDRMPVLLAKALHGKLTDIFKD